MVRRAKEKTASLVYVAILCVTYFLIHDSFDFLNVGVWAGCPWWHSLTYHHFHGSVWHLLCNAWGWLSVVFVWEIGFADMAVAYVLASSYVVCADMWGCETPVVGLSGVIYAMFGMKALCPKGWKGRLRYNLWVALWIGASSAVASDVSVWCHVWCYALGFIYAIINYPFWNYGKLQENNG